MQSAIQTKNDRSHERRAERPRWGYKRISIKPKKIFRVLSILYIANFCETSKSKLYLSRGCALNNEGQKLFQLGCALN